VLVQKWQKKNLGMNKKLGSVGLAGTHVNFFSPYRTFKIILFNIFVMGIFFYQNLIALHSLVLM
jgi:hypothetical protein